MAFLLTHLLLCYKEQYLVMAHHARCFVHQPRCFSYILLPLVLQSLVMPSTPREDQPSGQGEPRPDRLTSRVVGENLARLRRITGMTTRVLAEKMVVRLIPMSSSGITDIERGRRGVSVDQLTALADALGVSPLALLIPQPLGDDGERADPDAEVRLTGTDPEPARDLAAWLRAERSLADDHLDDYERETYRRRSLPWWYWKKED